MVKPEYIFKTNFPNQSFIAEGVTVISEETYGQLMDTFENVEQEEFFEVLNIDDIRLMLIIFYFS